MGLNVSVNYSNQYENKEQLREIAKHILNNGGANSESAKQVIDKSVFLANKTMKDLYTTPQLDVLKASTQITLNNSLKETLKYLKSHSQKSLKYKAPVLGELWKNLEASNSSYKDNELYDFELDKNAKNIFAA